MLLDAFHKSIEFRALLGIVERGGGEQRMCDQRAQPVTPRRVEFVLAAPHEVPAAVGELGGRVVVEVRSPRVTGPGPVTDNRDSHLPCGLVGRLSRIHPSRKQRGSERQTVGIHDIHLVFPTLAHPEPAFK